MKDYSKLTLGEVYDMHDQEGKIFVVEDGQFKGAYVQGEIDR